jgi:hypothetical protein
VLVKQKRECRQKKCRLHSADKERIGDDHQAGSSRRWLRPDSRFLSSRENFCRRSDRWQDRPSLSNDKIKTASL